MDAADTPPRKELVHHRRPCWTLQASARSAVPVVEEYGGTLGLIPLKTLVRMDSAGSDLGTIDGGFDDASMDDRPYGCSGKFSSRCSTATSRMFLGIRGRPPASSTGVCNHRDEGRQRIVLAASGFIAYSSGLAGVVSQDDRTPRLTSMSLPASNCRIRLRRRAQRRQRVDRGFC